VRLLADRTFGAGTQRLEWDGTDDGGHRLSPGVYFIQLTFGNQSRVHRMAIVR